MKRRFFKKKIFSIGPLSIIIIFLTTNLYAQEIKTRVIKQGAVLKLKPNKESLTIKRLPLGALLDSLESIGEWIKIKLPPDKDGIVITGYIHKSFIEFKVKQSEPQQKKELIIPETPKKIELTREEIDNGLFFWQKTMTTQELKATGVTTLTPAQRAALNKWLNDYTQRIIQLTHPPSGGSAYSGVGGGHWIKKKITGGRIIILEDNSLWEIYSIDSIYTMLWLSITSITVIESDSPIGDYKYLLINTDDGEKALAKYLGK